MGTDADDHQPRPKRSTSAFRKMDRATMYNRHARGFLDYIAEEKQWDSIQLEQWSDVTYDNVINPDQTPKTEKKSLWYKTMHEPHTVELTLRPTLAHNEWLALSNTPAGAIQFSSWITNMVIAARNKYHQ